MWETTKAGPVVALAFVLPASPSPSYDANGNQKNLTATGESISWNALNQPISMNGVTASYDALGRMVETGSGSSYQQFVFRPSGALLAIYNAGTTTLVKGTVPLPGGDTAIYNASGLSYLRHTDWLGSSRLATTWAHTVYSKTAYAPFGETYNEAGTADRPFTGQDQDVVTGSGGTGAYDFLYRKHDPSAGRWLSPDPSGWDAVDQTNPQTLNRYTYVTNDPLGLIDQLGLCPQVYAVYHQTGSTTWTFTGVSFVGDNGLPCMPPNGCQFIVNADGAYQGMQCNSGTPANMQAYCAMNNCPTGQSPGNANQPSLQQKMRQAAHYICGNSPADRVAKSVLTGSGFGAAFGAVTGFVSGEVFGGEVTLGASGFLGAYVGAHVGAAVGAINGLAQGAVLAGVCYAGFVYDN
jgi:RHS repeat-associated protein